MSLVSVFNQRKLDSLDSSIRFVGTHANLISEHNCNLSKANFLEAKNYAINPQVNKIQKGKFSIPEALSLLRGFEIELS